MPEVGAGRLHAGFMSDAAHVDHVAAAGLQANRVVLAGAADLSGFLRRLGRTSAVAAFNRRPDWR
jgi:hypothetical protein